MDREGQLPDPVADLLAGCERAAPSWIRRSIEARIAGGAAVIPSSEVDAAVSGEAGELLGELRSLLTADVDEQRANPLALFRRAATRRPTELLRRHGVPPVPVDAFVERAFPDDPYAFGPASWSEVDPALHEPGLAWGAWKAMTVLRRRRDEGLR